MVGHEWEPSPYGHGEARCKHCLATNREIAVIGDIDNCAVRDANMAKAAANENKEPKCDK